MTPAAPQAETPPLAPPAEAPGQPTPPAQPAPLSQAAPPAAVASPEQSTVSPAMSAHESLRAKARPLFERFDTDRSGAISVEELGQLCIAMGTPMTTDQLKRFVADADPDKSGKIEFEEFVVCLEQHMASAGDGGKAGLGSLLAGATSMFGWANPKNWFAPAPAAAPAAAPASAASGAPGESKQDAELRAKARPIFDKFDKDGSGAVSAAELGALCAVIGQSQPSTSTSPSPSHDGTGTGIGTGTGTGTGTGIGTGTGAGTGTGTGTDPDAHIRTPIQAIGSTMSAEQLKQMMVDADPNKSGEIDFEE